MGAVARGGGADTGGVCAGGGLSFVVVLFCGVVYLVVDDAATTQSFTRPLHDSLPVPRSTAYATPPQLLTRPTPDS